MSTGAGMEVRTGVGTGTIIYIKVEGRESLGTSEVVLDVGRKTREGGRRQRVTSNHSRQTRCPSKTVISCGGPEPRGTGSGRAKEGRKRVRNLIRVIDVLWETGEIWM